MPRAYVFRSARPRLAQVAGLVASDLLGRGDVLRAPCLAFVLRHPDAGAILVDTGFHGDVRTNKRGDLGTPLSVIFRKLAAADEPFDDQLRIRGVDPDAVERVVMTHLHGDHTSGMRLLPNARFTCTRKEWATARAGHAAARGFVAHHLPAEERVDLLDLDRDGEPHGPFARTLDVLGDGTIRLVSTPGHTAGHMSVLLRTDSGPVLLVGDAAYTRRSIREQVLPLMTDDDDRYRASLDELKAFGEQEPGAVLVPSHDPDAWRELI